MDSNVYRLSQQAMRAASLVVKVYTCDVDLCRISMSKHPGQERSALLFFYLSLGYISLYLYWQP